MQHITAFSRWLALNILKYPVQENGQMKLAQIVVGTLSVLQSWPANRSSLKNKLCYASVFLYCNITVTGICGHIIKLYITGNLTYNNIAVDVAILTLAISGYQYCSSLFGNRHLAKYLLEEMGDFRKYTKPPGIEMADAILNAIFGSSIITIFMLTPPLLAFSLLQNCDEDDYSCGFIYPFYYPGVMSGFPRKIFIVLQMFSAWTYALLGTGCVWVGMHMAEYIVIYLRHTQTLIKQTSDIVDCNERRQRVIDVVRYHHRIIFLYDHFQKVAPGIFVVHAISTPVVMAMFVQTFKVDFQVQCLLIFGMWTITFSGICFMGQRMANESEILAKIIYDCIPLDGDLETTKMLLMMLVRTQKPMLVPAGSLTWCGHALFVTVIKATYSYLTVIENIRE